MKIYSNYITLLLLFLTVFLLQSQITNLPVKIVKGKNYYEYTVQQSEGLYGISKKFNVNQEIINALNPEISEGLKVGQKILIPVDISTKSTVENIIAINYVDHVVQKRQTLFAISRKYKVNVDLLKKINPQIENGLKTGDTIKIPVMVVNDASTSERKVTITPKAEQDKIHIVTQKETLYSISKQYNVTIEDLIQLNPGVENGLKNGFELKIPTQITTGIINNSKKSEKDTILKKEPSIKLKQQKTLRIAYLLPLLSDPSVTENGNDKFAEFFAGSLLAIEEEKKAGNSFEIFVYDTEKSENKMAEVLENPELLKMDLIIGPAYSNQVAMMSDFSRQNHIKTLIPFSSKVFDIEINPWLYQFNPGTLNETLFVSSLLSGKLKNSSIIFIETTDLTAYEKKNQFFYNLQTKLDSLNRSYTSTKLKNSEISDFMAVLKKGKNNLIIFDSEKISDLSPFIETLISLTEYYDISLYKHYGWLNNDIKLKGFYISPFQAKLNDNQINKFSSEFKNIFNWTNSFDKPRYDLLGYDLTKYFANLMVKDFKFDTENKLPTSAGIQSEFEFERATKKSGLINKHLFYIEN